MSQSRDQLPIANSRLELAGACQLKVVITLRLSTQTHEKTTDHFFGPPAPCPLSIDLRRAQCTHEHSARERTVERERGLG